ncbi:DUF2341 domain-containing protein [Candidatus Methanodesulfokora washburnensis]|nr:DUF2341 domain-containing protein [Candidatus Methanodesulfokores washburnensis]
MRKLIPLILFLLILAPAFPVKAAGHYRYITVYNPNNYDLTDYQVRIDLTSYTLTDSTGTDVRFYDENGNLLPFYRESWAGSQAGQTKVFWVKMSIPASSSKRIKITYATGAADASQIIWDFYDDFSSFTNGTRWYIRMGYGGSNIIQVESGWLHLHAQSSFIYIESIQKFTSGIEIVYVDKMSNYETYSEFEIAKKWGFPYELFATNPSVVCNGYWFDHSSNYVSNYHFSIGRDDPPDTGQGEKTLAHSSGTYYLDFPYTNKIQYYKNGTIIWYLSGYSSSLTLKGTDTAYINDQMSLVFGLGYYISSYPDRYIDYIYVRKLADKEPTYTVTVEDVQQLATPTLVSPSGYVNTTSVTLSWNGVANANSYWVQVSPASDFSSLALNATTTSTTYPFSASEKTYYWRVKALGSGSYLDSNWSSVLSFTVDVTPPSVSLTSPANATVVTTSSFTLQWSSSDANGISSQILYVTYPSGSTSSFTLDSSYTSYTVSSADGKFYWQIKAIDNAGNSKLSEKRLVYVDTAAPSVSLSSPLNASVITTSTVTLQWSSTDSTGISSQVLYVTYPNGTVKQYSLSATATSYTITSPDGKLYWQVKATDLGGHTTTSAQWMFYIDTLAPSVSLNSPSNGTVQKSATVTLQWSSTDAAGISSQVLYVTYPNATTKQYSLSGSASSYSITSDDGLIYWQVKATDLGGHSTTSAKWCFVVDTRLPAAPSLTSPANNSQFLTNQITLQWSDSDYDVMQTQLEVTLVGGGYSYTKTYNSRSGSETLAFTQEGTYKWHVTAVDYAYNRRDSGVYYFTVFLGSVVPLNLTGNSTGYSFVLKNKDGAQTASYSVSVIDQYSNIVFSTSSSVSLSSGEIRKISGLFTQRLSAGSYTLKVTATDAGNYQKTNSTTFIAKGSLSTPTLNSPSGWVNTTAVLLSWNPVINAGGYQVQVSNTSSFSYLFVNTTTASTSITFGASERTYYWRVKALGSAYYEDSAWSSVWNFTVDASYPLVLLVSPADASIQKSGTVNLQWSSSDNYAVDYQILYVTYPNGTVKQYSLSGSIASYTVTSDDGRLYWQVKAVDKAKNSYLSPKRTFYIDTRLPAAPTLVEPANNSWIQSDRVTLQWSDTDYDVMQTVLYVEKVGGGYSYTKIYNVSSFSTELSLTQEGTYKWYVVAVDWANNQKSSSAFIFNVVIGSVKPQNLSANSTSFSFVLYNQNGAQTAYYTAEVFDQNGVKVFSKSSSVSLAASEKYKISGSFSSPLSTGIYRLRVTATDARGVNRVEEIWFLVSGSASRDWSNWASDLAYLFSPVNFTRFYFEYGSAEGAHQVQLQFPSALSCTVVENTTKQQLSCYASASYISFTALPRNENQARTYFVSVLAPQLLTSSEKIRDVVYHAVKAEEYRLRIKNQYPYDILKLKINGTGWLGASLNETSLKPLEEINITYYIPYKVTNQTASQLNTSAISSFFGGNMLIYVFLFLILGVVLWRARR